MARSPSSDPGACDGFTRNPSAKNSSPTDTRLYSYLPADKQVIVSPAPEGQSNTPALFLTGKGNLVRDFTASLRGVAGAAPGLTGSSLYPSGPIPDVQSLILGVDPTTYQIRLLIASDRQGGTSTFTFSNLKENRGISDKIFEFRIPRGVDVVTSGVPSK